MRPLLRRVERPRPLVVLTSGWSGERVLVRLLAAGGTVRSSGFWFAVARPHPERDLRRRLRARSGDRVHLVLLTPVDVWAINTLDPHQAVAALAEDGISIVALARRRPEDTGLSRAVCGPRGELLPFAPRVVEPAEVLAHGSTARATAEWLDEVLPAGSPRLTFEDDLAEPAARAATLAHLADHLGVAMPWPPPLEREPPTADALWRRVANPEPVRRARQRLLAAGEA